MNIMAIEQGGSIGEFEVDIIDRHWGELFISTEAGAGTYLALPMTEEGSLYYCKAVEVAGRDNSLSEAYGYAFDDGEDIVLMDSRSTRKRAHAS